MFNDINNGLRAGAYVLRNQYNNKTPKEIINMFSRTDKESYTSALEKQFGNNKISTQDDKVLLNLMKVMINQEGSEQMFTDEQILNAINESKVEKLNPQKLQSGDKVKPQEVARDLLAKELKEQREQEALLNQPNRQTPSSFVSQNFSEAGRQDGSVHNRGEDGSDEGPLGIGVNDNGTSYSRNRDGTFTHEDGTTVNFTDRDGKPGNAPTKDEAREKRMAERTAKYDDPTDDTATSGEKNVVCTEMYRQTQLDDWAQAMKMWSVYQRKYLTTTHQIGYHWLFKPFVRGMKVNRVLTTIGASLAKKRTQHLRHVLTKGKAKDSILGNLCCKIIHPIVYLVGLAVRKK